MIDDAKIRAIFMGTPDYAIPILSSLISREVEVLSVYTRPDKPRGRGNRASVTPVKCYALKKNIPVFEPKTLKNNLQIYADIENQKPDLIVVAAYGLFLPNNILELPRMGAINLHPSLLPKYRGPSPIASAILNGDVTTGVSIIRLTQEMDGGPILAQEEAEIYANDTSATLTIRLFQIGAKLLSDLLPRLSSGKFEPKPQDLSHGTITGLLSRTNAEINWNCTADHIARQVRAYDPWPGCFTRWNGKRLKIIDVSRVETGYSNAFLPGHVVGLNNKSIGIGTSNSILKINKLQLEGKRPLEAAQFLQGHPHFIGSVLDPSYQN